MEKISYRLFVFTCEKKKKKRGEGSDDKSCV
jgi:hypothetical protein